MKKKEFIKIIETYGAKESCWPVSHARKLNKYIEQNPEFCQRFLKEEFNLEQALNSLPKNKPSDALLSKIKEQSRKRDYKSRKTRKNWKSDFRYYFGNKSASLLTASCVLLIGLVAGLQYQNLSNRLQWEAAYYQDIYNLPEVIKAQEEG